MLALVRWLILFRKIELWIQVCPAVGADPMAEPRAGMIPNVYVNLMPVAGIVADLFAGCADGE
jgi:hypothetical protein